MLQFKEYTDLCKLYGNADDVNQGFTQDKNYRSWAVVGRVWLGAFVLHLSHVSYIWQSGRLYGRLE